MTIIYRTSLELTLEKEVIELRGAVARSIQAINDYEREVAELKNKALTDYATIAGNAVVIRELEDQLDQALEQNTALDKKLAVYEKPRAPYAWRNPQNGVVISNDKKKQTPCVGAGYPNFSEPLYTREEDKSSW